MTRGVVFQVGDGAAAGPPPPPDTTKSRAVS
jgi:hypothetical protein